MTFISCHFANVTCWGVKARAFVDRQCDVGGYDIMGFVETHVKEADVAENRHALAKDGWKSWWCPARKTEQAEAAGGVAIVARKHLKITTVMEAAHNIDECKMMIKEAHDWTAVVIHLQGCKVLLVVLYMTDGISFKGVNLLKMRQVNELIDLVGLPFIIAAD